MARTKKGAAKANEGGASRSHDERMAAAARDIANTAKKPKSKSAIAKLADQLEAKVRDARAAKEAAADPPPSRQEPATSAAPLTPEEMRAFGVPDFPGSYFPREPAPLPAPVPPPPKRHGKARQGETPYDTRVAFAAADRGYIGTYVAAKVMAPMVDGEEAPRVTEVMADELMARMFEDLVPTSQLERMMCEQLVMTHAQIMASHGWAIGGNLDRRDQALTVTSRLMADFRKTVASLREWRAPVQRQTILAQQVNQAAAGGQQVITGPGAPTSFGGSNGEP